MSLEFKYRCQTCGEIFNMWSGAETHLGLENNENHIIVEAYLNEEASGISTQFILESPNGNKWKLRVDNNGVLTTELL